MGMINSRELREDFDERWDEGFERKLELDTKKTERDKALRKMQEAGQTGRARELIASPMQMGATSAYKAQAGLDIAKTEAAQFELSGQEERSPFVRAELKRKEEASILNLADLKRTEKKRISDKTAIPEVVQEVPAEDILPVEAASRQLRPSIKREFGLGETSPAFSGSPGNVIFGARKLTDWLRRGAKAGFNYAYPKDR